MPGAGCAHRSGFGGRRRILGRNCGTIRQCAVSANVIGALTSPRSPTRFEPATCVVAQDERGTYVAPLAVKNSNRDGCELVKGGIDRFGVDPLGPLPRSGQKRQVGKLIDSPRNSVA